MNAVSPNIDPLRYHGQIVVGTIAIAKRNTFVCERGEIGVCYEIYPRNERIEGDLVRPGEGYSFIFEHGRYDGFSSADVDGILLITTDVDAGSANYQFTNVRDLIDAWRKNVFTFRRAAAHGALTKSFA